MANRRILLIDDMPTIHEDFRKILCPPTQAMSELDLARAALFGDAPKTAQEPFELDSAYQGEEGLQLLQQGLRDGRDYAVAFVDMRMPPGWDGATTVERLWEADPRLQVVICTAYSDTSWEEVLKRLDARDRLLILKKPFDTIEVRQLASALSAKWDASRQADSKIESLEDAVQERTRSLTQANEALKAEIAGRRKLEGQLLQAEKLASIGQLAAGVAHEINNPIGYVLSNVRMLEQYLEQLLEMLAAHEAAEPHLSLPQEAERLRALRERLRLDELKADLPSLIAESKEGIQRVRAIVQDLKHFSHIDAGQGWQYANLLQGIDSTLNIVASEVGHNAEIVKEFRPIPDVECLPSQIHQVILNLLTNAAHAIGDGPGTITLRTGAEDDQVWFEVCDDGCGIAPEHVSRVFDPFFTTKPVGRGTGLGLSLSYGIVRKHGGRIEVRSEVGQGTTFRVWLPVSRAVRRRAEAEAIA